MKDTVVELTGLTKRYGAQLVARNVNLTIRRGEFLTLLGPSGCGKTTTLRMIAGLETPTSGTVVIDGHDQTDKPPYERCVNTVFQHYALFPHMTVAANIGYGLSVRRVPKAEIAERVEKSLAAVKLSGQGHKYPAQLSGGQKQRVALARALILDPKVLLLDEPLGALDNQLRRDMQLELKSLQQRLGVTFVLVTHDQEEALVLSDRIAVMNGGQIEQLDTARAVYERPHTRFVAEFLGITNFLSGRAEAGETGEIGVRLDPELALRTRPDDRVKPGDPVTVGIRPEKLGISHTLSGVNSMPATVQDVVYCGSTTKCVTITKSGLRFTSVLASPLSGELEGITRGSQVHLFFAPQDAILFPTRTDA
jgi:spermidine/putrescine transport system ATP-binding protein